jgi:hypothetical protein
MPSASEQGSLPCHLQALTKGDETTKHDKDGPVDGTVGLSRSNLA